MEQPEKMKLTSMDVAGEKREELKQCLKRRFPEVFAEDKIDFDQLKRVLGEWVDAGKERFGLNWPGKADCMKIIQQPSIATLKPCREESVNFDETENLFIEGDNLEVLKLLQKSYFGKVKMIYIDPPYNTGKEFIYPDKYAETLETYLAYTGQMDNEGKKFSTNTETTGRFHSRWLNMMYPRLYLARNLLREDGVIFISIDDNEVSNLQKCCSEIFGEDNFVANIIWQKKYSPQNDAKYFSDSHEHILLFANNIEEYQVGLLPRTKEADSRYKNPDNDYRGPWKSSDLTRQEFRPNDYYEIVNPLNGKKFLPPKGNSWGRPKEKVSELIEDGRIWFGPDGNSVPSLKRFLSEVKQGITPQTIWERKDVGDTQEGKKLIKQYFGNSSVYETPKPPRLIQRALLTANAKEGDIIMDFFAGSCATAEACFNNRKSIKFILVQLPEVCQEGSEPFKAGYKTIADIGKERIRRVIQKIEKEREDELPLDDKTKLDLGFRGFKLDSSNFKVWDGGLSDADEEALQRQLEMHVEHVSEESSQEGILFELLLKVGFPLTTKVRSIEMADKQVFSIENGAMLICLEDEVTPELIDAIAEADPLQVICLDRAFKGNDQLKANAVQTFKACAASKESEIVFMTV
jgi:adenine-specific DNA-methyltransferase